MTGVGRNLRAGGPTWLTLSAVGPDDPGRDTGADPSRDGTQGGPVVRPHVHGRRLCVPCTVGRFRQLNPTRARYSAELIAARIRRDDGRVWGAVNAFGVSYRHACRIRNGWRPDGRLAPAVPYRSRGWISGERVA